eukprot:6214836-Pleurochrysis_carterae.AAC.3
MHGAFETGGCVAYRSLEACMACDRHYLSPRALSDMMPSFDPNLPYGLWKARKQQPSATILDQKRAILSL